MRLPLPSMACAALLASLVGCGSPSKPVERQATAPAVSVAPPTPPPGEPVPTPAEPANPWEGEVTPRPNGAGPLPITTRDPTLGPDGALVTVVVFSDFECPTCAFYADYLVEVRQADPSPTRLVHKHYPLHGHPNSRAAAEAATAVLAIAGPEPYWRYYHRLFAEQRSLSEERYVAWAAELGISADRFRAVRAWPVVPAKVSADRTLGEQLGVNGTPYVFANCRALDDLEGVGQLIAEEHRFAVAALETGVAPANIYEHRCQANLKVTPPR